MSDGGAGGASDGGGDARDRVGPYRLLKAIGAGGSARIDLARLERVYGFQRHVVIKRPLEHLREDARAAAQLRREARLGGRLAHPNLVAVLDAGTHEGYDYLALEYVHGASLRELMQAEAGPRVRDVPVEIALGIAAAVARGLHHAHELTDEGGAPLGLVHRDVSPGNVLLAKDGAVKLADFGIAKETRVQTLSGSMHGTVTYMAPEQCRGHAFDRRADVFSLGVICYELVTGARLFWADNDVASLHRVLSGHVPRPREVRPGVPARLEALVMAALAHEPERRYPTTLALAEALEQYAAEAGASLSARGIARWVNDVLAGHAAEPAAAVIAAPRAEAQAAAAESSLVALIAAVPEEAPPDAAFGPRDTERDAAPAAGEPARGDVRRPDNVPQRRRKLAIGAGIAGGLAVGALAVFAASGGGERAPAATVPATSPSAASSTERAPAPTPVPAPAPAPPPPAPAIAAPEAGPLTPEPAASAANARAELETETVPDRSTRPAPARRQRPRRPGGTEPRAATAGPPSTAAEPPGTTVEPPPPPPTAAAEPPPAAKAQRPTAKWSPSIMLPTDSGSGAAPKR